MVTDVVLKQKKALDASEKTVAQRLCVNNTKKTGNETSILTCFMLFKTGNYVITVGVLIYGFLLKIILHLMTKKIQTVLRKFNPS